MDSAPLPNLDGLDREALKALVLAHQAELAALEAELESQRDILSEQSQELCSSSEQIEHLKLVIEKLRRRVFGVKSEKIVIQLEQLELHLEELESSQAPTLPESSAQSTAQTAPASIRNPEAVRTGIGERPHARTAGVFLEEREGEGRAGGRQRQAAVRQARGIKTARVRP